MFMIMVLQIKHLNSQKMEGVKTRLIRHKGKGNVIYRMFADFEADIYVVVDVDNTYDLDKVNDLIRILVNEKYDMVVGARLPESLNSYPAGHKLGNKVFNQTLS